MLQIRRGHEVFSYDLERLYYNRKMEDVNKCECLPKF